MIDEQEQLKKIKEGVANGGYDGIFVITFNNNSNDKPIETINWANLNEAVLIGYLEFFKHQLLAGKLNRDAPDGFIYKHDRDC